MKNNLKNFQRTIEAIAKNHNFDLMAGDGNSLTVKLDSNSFMPLVISTLWAVKRSGQVYALISVSHTYIQNGDVMRDPEVCFWINDTLGWHASEFRQDGFLAMYSEFTDMTDDGLLVTNAAQKKDTESFCNDTWAQNIRWQGYVDVKPVPPSPISAPETTSRFVDKPLPPEQYPLDEAVVLIRQGEQVKTNVPHLVVHHSPDGFEWGYGGSGPSDLALNICEYYMEIVRQSGHDVGDYVTVGKGDHCVRRKTIGVYQNFKWQFVASVPKQGGTIKANTIIEWLINHLD